MVKQTFPKPSELTKEEIRVQVLPCPDEAPLTACPWCGREYNTTEEPKGIADYEALEQENLYRHKPCGHLVRFYCWADDTCPNETCRGPISHFSGIKDEGGEIPPFLYCPNCMDWGYDDDMNKIAQLV